LKLVREVREIRSRQHIIVVLTGDGKWERRRILPPLCEKYNGKDKILWFPDPPIGRLETGLKPLNAVKSYIIAYKLTRFLFVVDREHLPPEKEISDALEEALRAEISEIRELVPHRAFVIEGRIREIPFTLYMVVFGRTSKVEEEIAELIKLKCGEEIRPERVKRFLRNL